MKPAHWGGGEYIKMTETLNDTITHLSVHLFVSLDGESRSRRVWPFGHLVTRATFRSGKVDTVAMSDHLIDLNYMVYMFHHDSTHHRSDGARLRNLSSMGRFSPSSGIEIPTSTKRSEAGAEHTVGPSGVFTTMEQARALEFKGPLSLLFCWHHRVCDGCELGDAQLTEDCLQCLLSQLLFSSLDKVIHNNFRSSRACDLSTCCQCHPEDCGCLFGKLGCGGCRTARTSSLHPPVLPRLWARLFQSWSPLSWPSVFPPWHACLAACRKVPI